MSDPQWDAWAEHMKETMLDDISIAILPNVTIWLS